MAMTKKLTKAELKAKRAWLTSRLIEYVNYTHAQSNLPKKYRLPPEQWSLLYQFIRHWSADTETDFGGPLNNFLDDYEYFLDCPEDWDGPPEVEWTTIPNGDELLFIRLCEALATSALPVPFASVHVVV